MTDRLSGRALATALGVTEKSVRKAVVVGRIEKELDGKFDLNICRARWNGSTDPARSKVRTSADQMSGPRFASPQSATSLQPDVTALRRAVAELPGRMAWAVLEHGGGLQLSFDIYADLLLDIPNDLLRGFAPVAIEPVDWMALADIYGLKPIPAEVMRADWQRRRDAPD